MLGAMGGGGNGSSPDQAREQLEGAIDSIREIDGNVQALAQQTPALAQEAQQIRQILKRMIVKTAGAAPTQTASAEAVPMAGA